MELRVPKDEHEKKAISDIKDYGVHIIHVFDPEGKKPDFTYSLGLKYSYNHPEVLIYGLPNDITKTILNSISDTLDSGQKYYDGEITPDILDGFKCCFKTVPKTAFKEHFGWNIWLNQGDNFEVLQLVWPNGEGQFPWSEGVSSDFLENQPVLARNN